ncbi:MAG TPA: secretin N-terminal domain-containing protein, partial [bacterium]|nr:secretin N-terminal domain-containing protein [bacterium]
GKSYAYLNKYNLAIEYLKKYAEQNIETAYADAAIYLLSALHYKINDIDSYKKLRKYLNVRYPQSKYSNKNFWEGYPDLEISGTKLSDEDYYSKTLSPDIKKEEREYENFPQINKIETNIEYVMLDFDRATIEKAVETIGVLTKIKYQKDFFNITDYITLKSDNKILLKFLPVLLNKILKDYGYLCEYENGSFIISKKNAVIGNYNSLSKYYYIIQMSGTDFNNSLLSLKELKIENVSTAIFKEFSYILLQSDDMENINNFLNTFKISNQNIGKYKIKNFKFQNAESLTVSRYLNSILTYGNNTQELNREIRPKSKSELIIKNIVLKQENLDLLKTIKSVENIASDNSLNISFPKDIDGPLTSIFNAIDLSSQKFQQGIKTYKIIYADAADVAEIIKQMFQEEIIDYADNQSKPDKRINQISFDKRTNSVILNADLETISKIDELVKRLDVKLNTALANNLKIRVYNLKYGKCSDVKKQFDMFLINNNYLKIQNVMTDERSNSIFIMAQPQDFNAIDKIVSELDRDLTIKKEQLITKIFDLKHRTPEYIVKNLEKIVGDGIYKNSSDNLKIIAVDKQNKIVAISDNPEMIATTREWLNRLDSEPRTNEKSTFENEIKSYVYSCKNVPAEDMANMINTMIKSTQQIQIQNKTTNPNLDETLIKNRFMISENVYVTPDKTSNSVLINATANDYFHLMKLIEEIDKIPDQILIDVVIAEVSLNDNFQAGIEWSYGKTNTFGTNMGLRTSESVSGDDAFTPLEGLRYSVLDTKRFNAMMNFMKTASSMKILSRPQITTVHNKKSVIKIGKEVPVTKISIDTINSNDDDNDNVIQQYTEFKDVGITLEVTPASIEGNIVGLNIHLIVSELDESQQLSGTRYNPIIKKREAETFGNVKSNNTIVIGGLIKQDEISTKLNVPVLSDIPLLGNLFKREQKKKENTELMFFITPVLTKSSALISDGK